MKKTIIISLTSFLLIGSTLTSCSEFLDGSAQNRSNIDVSELTSDQLLVYAYKDLQNLYKNGEIINAFVKGTDLYINQNNSNRTIQKTSSDAAFYAYRLGSDDPVVKDLYVSLYSIINHANGALEKAGSNLDKSACEARFLRGYSYYILLQQFGAVPYITSYIVSSERNYPRTSVQEVYDNVIADLTDVYNNGSLDTEDHEGHASKRAVAALLAKLNLAAGWDVDTKVTEAENGTYTVNDTKYFTQAKDWADKAIDGKSLSISYEDKWSPSKEGNDEEIFSVQFDRTIAGAATLTQGNGWQNHFSGYYQTPEKLGQKMMNHQDNPTKKILSLYTSGDERFDATFMTSMYKYDGSTWGTTGYYAYYNASDTEKKNMGIAYRFLPAYYTDADIQSDYDTNKDLYTNGGALVIKMGDRVKEYQYTSSTSSLPTPKEEDYYSKATTSDYQGYLKTTVSGLSCKKWDDPQTENTTNTTSGFRDIVLMHLSEMYLVRAEAKMMAGESYLDDINAVRTRSGAAQISSLSAYDPEYSHNFTLRDIDIILDERALELYAEGKRWEDLRRTKQLVLYNKEFNGDYNPTYIGTGENIKWYRPIPQLEINSNDGITSADQNPGY